MASATRGLAPLRSRAGVAHGAGGRGVRGWGIWVVGCLALSVGLVGASPPPLGAPRPARDAALLHDVLEAVRAGLGDADVLFPEEREALEGWRLRRELHEEAGGADPFAEARPTVGGAMPPLKRALHEFRARGLHPVPYAQEVEGRAGGPEAPRRALGNEQKYETGMLTEATTRPLRITANYDMLDEAKAPRYSTCFREGDWFKIGIPATSNPPSSPTCSRGPVELGFDADCWGLCEAGDVVTPDDALFIRSEIELLLPYVESLFRAPRLVGDALKLTSSAGSYPSLYDALGHKGPACFADCSLLLGLSMPSSYCASAGVQTDVLLFVQRSPNVDGIQGSAFSCASDQYGRPIGLVFTWQKDYEPIGSVLYDYFRDVQTTAPTLAPGLGLPDRTGGKDSPRDGQSSFRVVVHEVLHGLGFTIGSWLYHPAGPRVEQKTFVDADGTQSEVYAFKSDTRTHELMKEYYGCNSDAVGFPLMGWPTFARDSHQSTRMLPQDILAYGGGKLISPFTLSMMEDTGFYMANYPEADPISWGRMQGCTFVSSRCTYRVDDLSVDSSEEPTRCSVAYFQGISYVSTGSVQCAPSGCASYSTGTRTVTPVTLVGGMCNAECYSPDAEWYEDKEFSTQVALQQALSDTADALFANLSWLVWVFGAIVFLLAGGGRLAMKFFHATFFQTPQQTARWIKLIQGSAVVLGLIVLSFALYVRYVDWAAWDGFISEMQVTIILCTGLTIFFFSAIQLWVAMGHYRNSCAVWTCMISQVIFIIVQILAFYYVFTLLSSSAQLVSDDQGRYTVDGSDGTYIESGLRALEFTACETYRTCCRDPELLTASELDGYDTAVEQLALETELGKSATCVQDTQGGGTALARAQLAEQDPSQSTFCVARTGVNYDVSKPEEGSCDSFFGGNFIPVDRSSCQVLFCESGVSGYLDFLQSFLSMLESWSTTALVAFSVLLVIQMLNFALFEGLREVAAKLNYLDHDDHLHYTPGEGDHLGGYHAHHTSNLKRDAEQDGLHWEQLTHYERMDMIKEYGIESVRSVFPGHRIQTPVDSDDDD